MIDTVPIVKDPRITYPNTFNFSEYATTHIVRAKYILFCIIENIEHGVCRLILYKILVHPLFNYSCYI